MKKNIAQDYNKKKGFGVAPSPFNGVKLELGIMISLGMLAWFVIHYVTPNEDLRFFLLMGFGIGAMLRLIYKTRTVVRQIGSATTENIQKES